MFCLLLVLLLSELAGAVVTVLASGIAGGLAVVAASAVVAVSAFFLRLFLSFVVQVLSLPFSGIE